MDYLGLLQRAVRESRVGIPVPSAVTGLSGLAADLARWTAEAWEEIQRENHKQLKCLRVRNFTATALTIGTNSYSITAGSPDLAIANFGAFDEKSLYTQKSDGSSKQTLTIVDYEEWLKRYKLATLPDGQPSIATMPSADTILFNAMPDLAYQFKGDQWRSPQVLSGNTDTPLLPARFHMVIVWEAVKKLAADRENATQFSEANEKANAIYAEMVPDEIVVPAYYAAAPLA